MNIKNAIIFKLSGTTPEELCAATEAMPFSKPTAMAAASSGFVSVDASLSDPFRQVGDVVAFAIRFDDKLLPASVVSQYVDEIVNNIDEAEGRRVGRKERKEIKERVTDDLLAKAFIKTKVVRGFVDFKNSLLAFDTSSPGKAEEMLSKLMKAFSISGEGVLPNVEYWRAGDDLASSMSTWLQTGECPEGFTIDNKAMLYTPDGGGKVRISDQDVTSDNLRALLGDGRECRELAMTLNDKFSFVLTSASTIKRITLTDIANNEADERQMDMLPEALVDAHIVMNAGVINEITTALHEAVSQGGE